MQYYRNLLESSFGNSEKVWSNTNSILGKTHRSQNISIKLDGIIVSEPEPIASTFNFYFNYIPIFHLKVILINDQIPESENFTQTSIVEIIKVVHKLKNSDIVGWNNI